MLKTCLLAAAALLALGVAPAAAQSQRPVPQPRSAVQAATPVAAVVAAPAVGVVVDPKARTAVLVPINPQADVPPDVAALLAALAATGKVKPGQVVQIVVHDGDKVTEVIANAPIP